jgi:hypothetical protein
MLVGKSGGKQSKEALKKLVYVRACCLHREPLDRISFDFYSPNEFTTYVIETAGPLQTILANQTHKKEEEILKAITDIAKKYADNNTGKVKLDNEYICIVGKKLNE